MLYISNSFSINMLPDNVKRLKTQFNKVNCEIAAYSTAILQFVPVTIDLVRERIAQADNVQNIIGHADSALAVAIMLPELPKAERKTVKLEFYGNGNDELLVCQYSGDRLPEGTTILPDGAELEWWWVIPDYHQD